VHSVSVYYAILLIVFAVQIEGEKYSIHCISVNMKHGSHRIIECLRRHNVGLWSIIWGKSEFQLERRVCLSEMELIDRLYPKWNSTDNEIGWVDFGTRTYAKASWQTEIVCVEFSFYARFFQWLPTNMS